MEENRKEVTDEKLEEVNGGGWWSSKNFYESGDKPKYAPGKVIARGPMSALYILRVNEGKHGLIYKEFTYYVVFADDHSKVYDANAYESQLMQLELESELYGDLF